ncbi:MAG: hypothetical protein M0R80_18510 [Proteobacteria bacterium]|jgi:hypothetical protein|nr:hypothetical protein [Pseudomonadota bacterium]
MEIEKVYYKNMDLLEVKYKGVIAHFFEGNKHLTLYDVESTNKGSGEVQKMLQLMMEKYPDKKMKGTTPLNPIMEHIYKSLGSRNPADSVE